MIGRWPWALGAPLSLLGAPALALADEPPGCPPGEWFCEDAEPVEPAPAPPAAPEPEGEPQPERTEPEAPAELEADVPPPAFDRGWSESAPRRWALALRGEGVLLESGRHDAQMGGIGASLRFAPSAGVALDLGLDSLFGTDYNGYDRSEVSLSSSVLLFLNPRSVVRTYVLVGLNLSSARVDVGGDEQGWGYFGGHAGLGLEFVLDSHVALDVDVLAFMRGRTDSRAAGEPEFTDDTGRVTNTSGGGLLRGGLVLRF